MFDMFKYEYKLIQKAMKIFPKETRLHEMMKSGDSKAIDFVYKLYEMNRAEKLLDEDLIIKKFRQNQQEQILQVAISSKNIRDLYREMYLSEISIDD